MMNKRDKNWTVRQLDIYFWHLNKEVDSGYPAKTILAKIISGDMGGSKTCSSVPQGIELSSTEYLQAINRVDLALAALHTHEKIIWVYIFLRYGRGFTAKEIIKVLGCSERTCRRINRKGIEFVMEGMQRIKL